MADNAAVMQAYFSAWLDNDWDRALAFWDDDIVHHVAGHGRLSGDFRGKQAFLDAYRRVFAELDGTIEVVSVHEFMTKGEHAAALVTERAVRGTASLEFNRVVVYHVRHGRIVETWSFDWDPPALDRFWARPDGA